jgi:hypothetical protein
VRKIDAGDRIEIKYGVLLFRLVQLGRESVKHVRSLIDYQDSMPERPAVKRSSREPAILEGSGCIIY